MTLHTKKTLSKSLKQSLKKIKKLNNELVKCSVKKCPNSLSMEKQTQILGKCRRNYKCFSKTQKKISSQIDERINCENKHCSQITNKIAKAANKLGNISSKLMKH